VVDRRGTKGGYVVRAGEAVLRTEDSGGRWTALTFLAVWSRTAVLRRRLAGWRSDLAMAAVLAAVAMATSTPQPLAKGLALVMALPRGGSRHREAAVAGTIVGKQPLGAGGALPGLSLGPA
jgi:hypothetical protein